MQALRNTDQYKLTMARAGYPLREEVFYYSHRKGNVYIPPRFDLESWIRDQLPVSDNSLSNEPLLESAILDSDFQVIWNPEIEVFAPRDPIFAVRGNSALVSWLEPTILRLNRRLQIYTILHEQGVEALQRVASIATCQQEKDLTLEALSDMGVKPFPIDVRSEAYYDDVYNRALNLIHLVDGDADRIFEVGMRATSCTQQHNVALSACKAAGIMATSNVLEAHKLSMKAVGTMGHEHIQRFGSSYNAFTTMRDRTLGYVSYLLDTYNTCGEGIPAAIRTIQESPARRQGIRFDSEYGIEQQYRFAVNACRQAGVKPDFILESGWNDVLTARFEEIRKELGVPADRQMYGIGGYLVKPLWDHLSRDGVSAVYKLCSTNGRPTMKFGDEPGKGKESLPGIPYLFQPGQIGQFGETNPYIESNGKSSITNKMIWDLVQDRERYLGNL